MTTSNLSLDATISHPGTASSTLLISLASTFGGEGDSGLERILGNIALALPGQSIFVATPQGTPTPSFAFPADTIRVIHYPVSALASDGWVLTAADFLNALQLAEEHSASGCLILGAEAQTLSPEAIRSFATALLDKHADLVMPCYHLGPHDGLVNSAILYPVTRALYGGHSRFPLAIDLGVSVRMAKRLYAAAHRCAAANQNDGLLWPGSEAVAAGYKIVEIDAPNRTLPPPEFPDLNALLARIASSLFSDVEAKAAFWQRLRSAQPLVPTNSRHPSSAAPEVAPMLDAFRLAYTSLHEIWALVLPPASLLGLKRLSQLAPEEFRMPDPLWARIVYDFILAFHIRTINRGHLLGALTPLYLAWVASHLIMTAEADSPELHIEAVATAFEASKPYFVSRWRWPDRFNP